MAAKAKTETKKEVKPAAKAPAKATETKPAAKAPAKKSVKLKEEAPKEEVVVVDTSVDETKKPKGKTVYHVSKRENDGREWKVFIQGSTKVIKLFDTQLEALEYAKQLCKNKDDGSYVVLHRLDGKIRKY